MNVAYSHQHVPEQAEGDPNRSTFAPCVGNCTSIFLRRVSFTGGCCYKINCLGRKKKVSTKMVPAEHGYIQYFEPDRRIQKKLFEWSRSSSGAEKWEKVGNCGET